MNPKHPGLKQVADELWENGSNRKLTVGSLFAGIGGFDLGLERTGGFEVKWQVEINEYCQKVLAKHWPNVKRYGDIRTVAVVERVDVLCGGFPCQDISNAGKRAGIAGERSGLWSEYVRLIGEIRPKYVIVENVSALLVRGIERVAGDLASLSYDLEWQIISASAVGAPHRRERIWIVAYPESPSANKVLRPRRGIPIESRGSNRKGHSWTIEPQLGRVADGIPDRVDRLRALGNAVVPQIVEWIGNQILAYERSLTGVSS